MAEQRFNLSGLTEAVEELTGNSVEGPRLPIAFELPDGRIAHWARLSIQMVPSTVDPGTTPPHRALVIRPVPD